MGKDHRDLKGLQVLAHRDLKALKALALKVLRVLAVKVRKALKALALKVLRVLAVKVHRVHKELVHKVHRVRKALPVNLIHHQSRKQSMFKRVAAILPATDHLGIPTSPFGKVSRASPIPPPQNHIPSSLVRVTISKLDRSRFQPLLL